MYSRRTHTLAQTDRIGSLWRTLFSRTVVHTVALLRPNLTRRTATSGSVRGPLQLTNGLTVEELSQAALCVVRCTLQSVCLSVAVTDARSLLCRTPPREGARTQPL